MPNYLDIIKERQLTCDSPFEALAQACIEANYWPPYPGHRDVSDTKQKVNRHHHGGVHASFTALFIELMISLYGKYKPELLVDQSGQKIGAYEIKLMKLAAVYHDAANTSETMGDEHAHARLFCESMLVIGYSAKDIFPFVNAIASKDTDSNKDIYTKLLQSADCLEIIRVVGRRFDKTRLDIFKDLHTISPFVQELDQIIENHFETVRLMEESQASGATFHVQCEFSSNCYLSIQRLLERFLLQVAIKQAAEKNKIINLEKLMLEYAPLDLFNRTHSALSRILISQASNDFHNETAPDVALVLYKTEGLLIRAIRYEAIEDELTTLWANYRALKNAGINNPSEMRHYIAAQAGKKFTPNGFKWRPCSYIEKGLPIEHFRSSVGIVIDPRVEAGTQISFFYKKNIASSRAAGGFLDYFPNQSGKKERSSLAVLRHKIHEQERRRRGHQLDMNAHYYGRTTLRHSELLGTYQQDGVVGIIVSDLNDMPYAFLLQTKFCKPIYQYTPEKGLVRLSNELVKRYLLSPEEKLKVEPLPRVERILATLAGKGVTAETSSNAYYLTLSNDIPGPIRFQLLQHLYGMNEIYQFCFGPPIRIEFLDGNPATVSIALKDKSEFQYESLIHILNQVSVMLSDDDAITKRNKKCMLEVNHALKVKTPLMVTQKTPLSMIAPANPIIYQFTHPVELTVECQAFVDEGEPIIKLIFPDGSTYIEKTNQLPAVANQYYEEQAEKLQKALLSELMVQTLEILGIKKLSLTFESDYEKSHFILKYKIIQNMNEDVAKNGLLSLLNIHEKKPEQNTFFNTTASATTSEIEWKHIKIHDVQNVEALNESLQCFIEQSRAMQSKWKRL